MALNRQAVGTVQSDVRFLNAPFASRTWRQYGFLWLVLLLAPFALAYGILSVALTVGTAVTVVGLFVAGGVVLGGRGWGATYRGLVRNLLDVDITPPAPYVRRRLGFWRTLGSMIGDPVGWRAVLFMIVSFPATVVSFLVSTVFLCTGLGGLTFWYWHRFLPLEQASDGTWYRGGELAGTALGQLVIALGGLVLLFLWPWVQWLFVALIRVLAVALLSPTRASVRVAELEASRAGTVDDADARLRRIERDLHDGTQARLVAVAMQLGEAKEQLARQGDPREAAQLLDTAHTSTKEALVELRELARGIHPPALDDGLAVALATLAARAPLPVTVEVDPRVEASGRLAPAIESIAYFTIAELVTNTAKHARASGVRVLVERFGTGAAGAVGIQVHDDGRGGASVVPPDGSGLRSGLAGLAERVRSVDGTFEVSSPVGGPTLVAVTLPAQAAPRRG
ncbi:Signal transduction histidine kinase [Promicromonospora umidemergens]|uniref:histidine kinase n=2 Tax=Promicromonospora umidemergens TaxID=629679 RepID=A0ABP8Y9X9_9MICO|nr:Signal transduction histidine kinase [Promicromonospora umidemergens]